MSDSASFKRVTGHRTLRFERPPEAAGNNHSHEAMHRAMVRLGEVESAIVAGRVATVRPGTPGESDVTVELDGCRVTISIGQPANQLEISGEAPYSPAEGPAGVAAARSLVMRVLDDTCRLAAEFERTATPAGPLSPEEISEIELRATTLFSDVAKGQSRSDDLRIVARCIDLTTLEGDDTPGRVRALCAQAIRPDPTDASIGPTAAVCVYPSLVPLAVELTAGTNVAVASVAGYFPSGLASLDVRLLDIAKAVEAGAGEVDIVLDRSAFLTGRHTEVAEAIKESKRVAGDAHLKVILEVGELGSIEAIRAASRLAIESGADTIKTSTGKTKINASPVSVLVMAECIADHYKATGIAVGLKVAGGVRTADEALGYVAIVEATLGREWLTPERFRFGASSLLGSVVSELAAVGPEAPGQ